MEGKFNEMKEQRTKQRNNADSVNNNNYNLTHIGWGSNKHGVRTKWNIKQFKRSNTKI